jgi:hypothetical protein
MRPNSEEVGSSIAEGAVPRGPTKIDRIFDNIIERRVFRLQRHPPLQLCVDDFAS